MALTRFRDNQLASAMSKTEEHKMISKIETILQMQTIIKIFTLQIINKNHSESQLRNLKD